MADKYKKLDVFFYVYLLLITVSSISSQFLFKKAYANSGDNKLVLLGLLAYTFTGYCVYSVLSYGNLVILNIIWHLIYFVILFIIGFLIFKEKFSYQQLIASLFGMLSLIIFMFYGVE
jgi:drug/metabolite transporter (DMT)-like permease|uniref:EamA domain-containing protein n=1 Tax=viral metagenome TaxID=1070528 RepID=A0A6C0DVA3_9ZZZZ